MRDSIEFDKAIIQRVDDIIITTYKKEAVLDLIDAKEFDAAYVSFSQGKEVFYISDLTAPNADLTNDAQAYFSRKARIVPNIKAAAIIINTLRGRLVARFYIQYFKPLYPTKIFGSVEEAQQWFESIRKSEQLRETV
ncbi:MAG: hypothetical protein JNJ99_11115 [Crocinitomicaceae bacterium]|nr:hypothetical protein [Crocinitomicaceae bacterium]